MFLICTSNTVAFSYFCVKLKLEKLREYTVILVMLHTSLILQWCCYKIMMFWRYDGFCSLIIRWTNYSLLEVDNDDHTIVSVEVNSTHSVDWRIHIFSFHYLCFLFSSPSPTHTILPHQASIISFLSCPVSFAFSVPFFVGSLLSL